ncbi:DNA-binding transcriptional regulator, GntR family [Duganella sp. CF402]|uniref:GntR family transcriptional regulator n=1 Tax=unclassified Duganella TaxID=2636909 RepID=UPI0008D701D0|nr:MULTISPECIES: GntR family transcriptional regulator [unclassified Duganella]RZT06248.1 GntR family transcriptional regulator [Duganella sp. BK701]SEM70639.1 DNA-binding transcriptional regulator, GntR family [Duganella sp. CF402]
MPIPDTAPAIPRPLAREEVYRSLKQWIVDLTLAPNEILRDHDLAERLGVSRTPVREALRQLEDEGLVITSFHKWTKVAPAELDEVLQLYPVVAALEAAAVRLAQPQLSPADFDRLAAINQAMAQAIARGDSPAATGHDTDFHALLVERSGNHEIARLLRSLRPRIQRIELAFFGNQPLALQSVADHDQIIAALQRADADAACAAMQRNWEWQPTTKE